MNPPLIFNGNFPTKKCVRFDMPFPTISAMAPTKIAFWLYVLFFLFLIDARGQWTALKSTPWIHNNNSTGIFHKKVCSLWSAVSSSIQCQKDLTHRARCNANLMSFFSQIETFQFFVDLDNVNNVLKLRLRHDAILVCIQLCVATQRPEKCIGWRCNAPVSSP